ncbi:DUF1028 domain-containing protein [Phytohabitans houttuyneae]|jgi:uncharacterized Ntn-hydrolase superfamily protein|uniref:Putative peptidoglycan binding domain-containing protein n=1 Tax=Phytohabitans houttuyneae TaxID=1076126 RepID=A0A6V8KCI0_9ACTN|nr:DUF1028 domain-containing protein [Phytohabitans houttuyneae]GFJ82923.1 hypothetical protein Phou_071030 [Phytohabitans houttuyneae]
MTFSIVARSADGQLHGVAVASKFLAVGAVVPAAEAQVGALATQAHANLAYRPQGLALLRTGVAASDVVAGLVAADAGRASRQLGVVGADGDGATYTGEDCHDWAGGACGPGWAAQGNILAGPEVIDAMRDAWTGAGDGPFPARLVSALRAGDEAGGDRRGRQSAALLVVAKSGGYGGGSDVLVDLRVDDHPDPVAELARLLDIHTLLFGRSDPEDLLDLVGELAEEVATLLTSAGYLPGGGSVDTALAAWAGVENLEERLVAGRIDPVVLAHLRTQRGRGTEGRDGLG